VWLVARKLTFSKGATMKRSKMEFLTPDELLAVLAVARERSVRDWAMILITYSHGLRASETCRLNLADVNLKDGSIFARRLKGSQTTTQQLMPHRGEPLLDEIAALRTWLKFRPTDSGDALFISQKGGHLSATQFYRLFRDIARAAGLPSTKQHPHVLKHSIASHLVGQNVNLAKVKQFLGHSAISSTMAYVSVSDQEASKEAHSALMNLF
jgi:site-specific recombinase XerD